MDREPNSRAYPKLLQGHGSDIIQKPNAANGITRSKGSPETAPPLFTAAKRSRQPPSA